MINVYLICAETNGKKLFKIGHTRRKVEERIKEFKEMINSKLENESLLMWETTKSVSAHDYYDYYIQEHQELEEYEECARLLKLKNEIPYSEELTHTIKKSGGKLLKNEI